MKTPIDVKLVDAQIEKLGVKDISKATIREIVTLVNWIHEESGKEFVRMEIGEPGLTPPSVGIEA